MSTDLPATPPIRVAIVDDHPVFRGGLRTLVQEAPSLEFVGEAHDGDEAVDLCAAANPDVLLMDIRMPRLNGIEATRLITAAHPSVGVLMLTMLEDDTSVFAAMRAGARGYVLKGAAPDDVVRAVTTVAAGESIFGAPIAARMRSFFTARVGPGPFPDLSPREREILDRIAAGQSNPAIAHQLGVSEKTVRNNVSAIFLKLQVADRPSAIVRAREAGLGRTT
jgi:DNA-binding NarL/FixJ family response regulator